MDIDTKHCMVDIEWLGKPPFAAIGTIGAVIFTEDTDLDARDASGRPLASHLYLRVDPRTSQAIGMEVEADTVLWWLEQNAETCAEMIHKQRTHIASALERFGVFYARSGATQLWGNGAAEDNITLDCAYRLAQKAGHRDLLAPWTFRDFSCFRTVKKLFPSILGGHKNLHPHHALEDAIFQAKAAQKALRAVRMVNEVLERQAA